MSTYLKHMGGYTYKQLKGKSFDEIQKLFDKEIKRVNTYVAMSSEVHENKEKKEEGREETAKEKESEEVEEDDEVKLKKLLVIKKDEDIAIDAIPLATKLPVLIDYKLHKEGMLIHYEFIGADGSSKRYSSMIRMIQGIDREDLEALWRIVKAKYGDTMPEDEFERVLYGDLRVMFEPDIKSDVWRMLQGYRVTTWKLIDSSGVYFDVTAAQVHNGNYAKRMEHGSVIKEAESSAQKDALEDKKRWSVAAMFWMSDVILLETLIQDAAAVLDDIDVDVTLVDETQERQDDDLMFDTGVLEDDEMHVEVKVDGKDEHSTKPDDSTV
ncbi:hypothetical protein Tco_0490157 [Tanacetum coccineum]